MVERFVMARTGSCGDVIADARGGRFYGSYAWAGETVEFEQIAGHPDRQHLLKVVQASAERIAPICQHFGTCGGCAVQHWGLEHYRTWKRGLVIEALSQARLEAPLDEVVDAHGNGRRRPTFHARPTDY